MSEQIIRRAGLVVDIQSTLPWLMATGVYVLLLALGPRLLSDPDTYSHIALGRWILDHHAIPTTDPFSANFRGTHWVAFEWLSQIAFAEAHAAGGWLGVVALTAAAVAAALGLLTRFLLREWQPNAALVAVLCALLLTAPHILARPHILALPVMVAWIATLIRTVDTHASPPWHILPLMIAMDQPARQFHVRPGNDRTDSVRRALACGTFGAIGCFPAMAHVRIPCLGAACLNPYGPEMILVTFRTVALGCSLDDCSGMALAGFYASRRVRSHHARRFWFCALPRRDIAMAANRNVVRRFASRAIAGTSR